MDMDRREDYISTGELGRRVDRMERTMNDGFTSLHELVIETTASYVRLDLYLSERDTMRSDLDALTFMLRWLFGLVVAIVLAVGGWVAGGR